MQRLYGARVSEVSSAAPINAWASRVTRKLVTQAVPPNLKFKVRTEGRHKRAQCDAAPVRARAPRATGSGDNALDSTRCRQVVATNALYFLGGWEWPFDANLTKPVAFMAAFPGRKERAVTVRACIAPCSLSALPLRRLHTALDSARRACTPTLQVPMMYQEFRPGAELKGRRQIAVGGVPGLFQALRMHYRNSSLAAIAVLPDVAKYGLDADAALADIPLAAIDAALRPPSRYVYLHLPKFRLKTASVSLKRALQAGLNVTAAFSDAADFGRLAARPLKIDDVLQSVSRWRARARVLPPPAAVQPCCHAAAHCSSSSLPDAHCRGCLRVTRMCRARVRAADGRGQ